MLPPGGRTVTSRRPPGARSACLFVLKSWHFPRLGGRQASTFRQAAGVGSNLALAEAPEQSKTVARSHRPSESVTVLDTSDPANPKAIQTFQGVTSLLQDNTRRLIFLT